jgi:ABC-type glycerol-3-phosphate transport system substrate-binding protein
MKRSKFIVAAFLVFLLPLGSVYSGGAKQTEAGGKTVITYQTWHPGPERIVQLEAAFEKANPDLDIEFVYVPFSDHYPKMKIDLSSGEGADVLGLEVGSPLAEFSNFLTDLTPYAEKEWGNKWPGILNSFANGQVVNNGRYSSIPLMVNYAGTLWVDRKWLAKYSLEVPKSLNDLRNAARVLRSHGDYPVAIGAKDDWINIDTWMNIANDISSQKLYSAIAGRTPFTDPALVESFKIWQQLFTEGIVQDGALGVNMYSDTTTLFETEGSIPMIFNGSWTIGAYTTPNEDVNRVFNGGAHDMVATRIDWNNDGKPAPIQASVAMVLSINKNSKIPDTAWRFIRFMLYEGQDLMVNALENFTSRSDFTFTGTLSPAAAVNYHAFDEWGQNNVGGYRQNPYPELNLAIADNLKALALNQITPERAAALIETVSRSAKR